MPLKRYLKQNVYEATQERLRFIFDEFENVLVSFSGGKDSGVLLNLAYDFASKNGCLEKLSLVHFDYEAMYPQTLDYILRTFEKLEGIKKYWFCLPISALYSLKSGVYTWVCWDDSKRDVWLRGMPVKDFVFNFNQNIFAMPYGETHRKARQRFFNYFCDCFGSKSINLIGIRADESLDRFRAICGKDSNYKGIKWILHKRAYPLYDWRTSDIWVANYKFKYDYNPLYDIFYQIGKKESEMRVGPPFNPFAFDDLKNYKQIAPELFNKMLKRVENIDFVANFGSSEIMGIKDLSFLNQTNCEAYLNSLTDNLDKKTRQNIQNKLKDMILKTNDNFKPYVLIIKRILRNDTELRGLNASHNIKVLQNRKRILKEYEEL